MGAKKRKTVMLRDICAAHNGDVQFANVKLVFLRPNTTSLIQTTIRVSSPALFETSYKIIKLTDCYNIYYYT